MTSQIGCDRGYGRRDRYKTSFKLPATVAKTQRRKRSRNDRSIEIAAINRDQNEARRDVATTAARAENYLRGL
jgi:hypothetical protein